MAAVVLFSVVTAVWSCFSAICICHLCLLIMSDCISCILSKHKLKYDESCVDYTVSVEFTHPYGSHSSSTLTYLRTFSTAFGRSSNAFLSPTYTGTCTHDKPLSSLRDPEPLPCACVVAWAWMRSYVFARRSAWIVSWITTTPDQERGPIDFDVGRVTLHCGSP